MYVIKVSLKTNSKFTWRLKPKTQGALIASNDRPSILDIMSDIVLKNDFKKYFLCLFRKEFLYIMKMDQTLY